jgi:SAM-dependent methyltransferase
MQDRVLRVLSARGMEDWRRLASSRFYARATESGALVATTEVADPKPLIDAEPRLATALEAAPAGILEHQRVPFVSYPYEWSFGMLRDAALLELELLRNALEEGMVLKDATPYNVQWQGARPLFIDVGSFEALRENEPWAGYRQFCMLFVYPLLIAAYREIPFHPWLRGSLEGIAPADASRMLSGWSLLRRGVLTHVRLHAWLERRNDRRRRGEVRKELRGARFKPELIKANAERLEKLLRRLEWKPGASAWSDYRRANTYSDADTERKQEFVRRAVAEVGPDLVWDLGCNDGAYARIAAHAARYVVACDSDHASVEALYRSLRADGIESILPLVVNLADPSPGLGWRGRERSPLAERGAPDLVLCLALIHHLSIAANIPLREVIEWLSDLGASLVIEFPTRDDPMVRRLLDAKREGDHPDYRQEGFERLLAERFRVERRESLPSGTRLLYLAQPRG